MRRVLPLLLCAVLGSGCYKVTYQNPLLPPNGVVQKGRSSFFVFGLVGDRRIAAYQMCPAGVAKIETKLTAGDVLFHIFTVFIYTPRSYTIECGGAK